jgi:hypothetical protein
MFDWCFIAFIHKQILMLILQKLRNRKIKLCIQGGIILCLLDILFFATIKPDLVFHLSTQKVKENSGY